MELTTKPLTEIHPIPFTGTAADNILDWLKNINQIATHYLEWSETAANHPCPIKRHSFELFLLLTGPNKNQY